MNNQYGILCRQTSSIWNTWVVGYLGYPAKTGFRDVYHLKLNEKYRRIYFIYVLSVFIVWTVWQHINYDQTYINFYLLDYVYYMTWFVLLENMTEKEKYRNLSNVFKISLLAINVSHHGPKIYNMASFII